MFLLNLLGSASKMQTLINNEIYKYYSHGYANTRRKLQTVEPCPAVKHQETMTLSVLLSNKAFHNDTNVP